jgi:serine-type D-Ala-D-Ala carboxypeptidase/endopeptidase (penicillin-binding protein 4)
MTANREPDRQLGHQPDRQPAGTSDRKLGCQSGHQLTFARRLAVLVLALAVLVIPAGPVAAKPSASRPAAVRGRPATKPKHDGVHARVAAGRAGLLRPVREAVGRREEPLTAEEETARQIERLLHGPLRRGVTGLFVADARTGEPLFSVNADDPLNPASNVKMISTATALELLGPDFRYPTRLLGATPEAGVVRGDAYLLGSHDPTLTTRDLGDIADAVAARGVTHIEGSIVVGSDPTRDGIYRAVIPIAIQAGEPGEPPTATAPAGLSLVEIRVTAKTAKTARRARLSYQVETVDDGAGRPRVILTIGGAIGKGGSTLYPLVTRARTALAAQALRAALAARGVTLGGDIKIAELDDFVAASAVAGSIPVELGRHESPRLAQIIARINKRSVNWLADRVIMTAAALVKRQAPSMELALAAMYDWLGRHPRIARDHVVVDTGSGLSYQTRITAHELVSIVRSAAGFAPDGDAALSHAWLDSLSVAGTDGTLSTRFRTGELRGRIRGKTGTLSTAIALTGILDFDPQRPLAFSLVTNSTMPLSKGHVRNAHDQVVGLLCSYLAKTRKRSELAAPATPGELAAPVAPTTELAAPAMPGELAAPASPLDGPATPAAASEPADAEPSDAEPLAPEAPDPEQLDADAALDAETAAQP